MLLWSHLLINGGCSPRYHPLCFLPSSYYYQLQVKGKSPAIYYRKRLKVVCYGQTCEFWRAGKTILSNTQKRWEAQRQNSLLVCFLSCISAPLSCSFLSEFICFLSNEVIILSFSYGFFAAVQIEKCRWTRLYFSKKRQGGVGGQAEGAFSRMKYERAPVENSGQLQNNTDPYVLEMNKCCFNWRETSHCLALCC